MKKQFKTCSYVLKKNSIFFFKTSMFSKREWRRIYRKYSGVLLFTFFYLITYFYYYFFIFFSLFVSFLSIYIGLGIFLIAWYKNNIFFKIRMQIWKLNIEGFGKKNSDKKETFFKTFLSEVLSQKDCCEFIFYVANVNLWIY